ncbi:MAG TPA: tetratricopeptide repeat protein [Acidobacteriaceae bacterium]|nr:tetratricopeptide repeat protein [Acidobacteriaceae bacterium]
MTRYNRQDVLRILRIHARQLQAWERAGLVASINSYGFEDLVQLHTLRDLSATRMTAASIRAGVTAMRAASGMENPLLEASVARRGSRLVFRHSGAVMEPITKQLVFDFDGQARPAKVECVRFSAAQQDAWVSEGFLEAVRYEESGRIQEAVNLYEMILRREPRHAPSAINLGTIFYNQGEFMLAEKLYRQAVDADSNYALAYFDLGNVLDELHRMPEAIEAYLAAIRLVPKYADAHYNLALAWERLNEQRKALKHWQIYLKLDPAGPWANHARGQVQKILGREKLAVVWRGSRPYRAHAGR